MPSSKDSIEQCIAKFKPAGGQSLRDTVTAELLNAIMDGIRALAAGENIQGGSNIRLKKGPSSVIITADTGEITPVAAKRNPFQIYGSPQVGSGAAPSDQGLRVKLNPGVVNNKTPTNMNAEIALPAGKTAWFIYLDATFDTSAVLQSVVIANAQAVPADPAGTLDTAPTRSYRALWTGDTNTKGITVSNQLIRTIQSVLPVVVAVSCGKNTVAYQWT